MPDWGCAAPAGLERLRCVAREVIGVITECVAIDSGLLQPEFFVLVALGCCGVPSGNRGGLMGLCPVARCSPSCRSQVPVMSPCYDAVGPT